MKAIEGIIMALLAIVIGVSLVPIIANSVKAGQTGNVTGTNSILLGLVTMIFIVGLIVLTVRKMIGTS